MIIHGRSYRYSSTLTDYRSGQHDGYAVLLDTDGNAVSKVDFSLYGSGLYIQYLETYPGLRRRGLATALIAALRKEYRRYMYHPGMATDDGAKFLRSQKKRVTGRIARR